MTLGIVAAAVLCFVVYPLLSMLLWVRGLCSLWEYVKNSREATPWARKQMGLGEEGEEWSLARQHAVKRNESYSSGKASSDDFNVAALLTTTTGMTMEDLRRNLASHRGIRRGREFAAALDEVLSRFPMGHQVSVTTTSYDTVSSSKSLYAKRCKFSNSHLSLWDSTLL